jgi:transposase-like protein
MNIDERKLRHDIDIKNAVGNMVDRGQSIADMRRVIGVSYETLDSIRKEHMAKKKKKNKPKPGY